MKKITGQFKHLRVLVKNLIERVWNDITTVLGPEPNARICFDEWNLSYLFKDLIKANYMLMDGLWLASVIHIFQQMSPVCPIANLAQMVNVLGLIRTDNKGVLKTPGGYIFELFWQKTFPNLLSTKVECEEFTNNRLGRIPVLNTPYIDCNATLSDDQTKIALTMINKHFSSPIDCQLNFEDFNTSKPCLIDHLQITHKNPFVFNTPENRTSVIPQSIPITDEHPGTIILPAHSFSLLTIRLD